jgi:hypothetical protein
LIDSHTSLLYFFVVLLLSLYYFNKLSIYHKKNTTKLMWILTIKKTKNIYLQGKYFYQKIDLHLMDMVKRIRYISFQYLTWYLFYLFATKKYVKQRKKNTYIDFY